jgi:hypothetical protein
MIDQCSAFRAQSETGTKPSVLELEILEADASALAKALPSGLDSAAKPRIIHQTILEPIVFGLEADQYPGRLAVPGDHDLLLLSKAQELREVILYF